MNKLTRTAGDPVSTLERVDAAEQAPTENTQQLATAREDGGRLGATVGRGDGGKTTFTRWNLERAFAEGRSAYIGDADPMNPVLQRVFKDQRVYSPGDASDAARAMFVRRMAELVKVSKAYVGIDLGGNDREYEKQGRAVDSKKMERLYKWGLDKVTFDHLGVNTSTFYLLRGALNDLPGLKLLLDSNAGKKDLVLVLNQGRAPLLPPGEDPFKEMKAHEVYQQAIKAGAIEFNMPALPPTAAKWLDDNRVKFSDAINGVTPEGKQPLSGWDREAIALWLGDMEDEVERTQIGHLLA